MNRKYSAAHFKKLIKKVRIVKPGLAITTDIIVGFPGESSEQFLNTKNIFKEIGFDMAYISQYSLRPGTVSAKMKDDVSREEKKNRFKILNEVLKESALKSHQNYLGLTLDVLVDGKNRRGKYCGKSSAFKTVMINTNKKLKVGEFVKVVITKAMPFGLEGDYVK
jgi:tRNA-2-methylthio-N6-dimethylallyladenosine synthase